MGAIEELSNKARNAAGILCMGNAECEELSGDLMRLADQVEAELAARGEERVVEVTIPEKHSGIAVRWDAGGPWPGLWHFDEGSEPPGHYEVRIRRLPDEPTPVEVWERPGGFDDPFMCSECTALLPPKLPKCCWKCGSLLASTATPWPGGA